MELKVAKGKWRFDESSPAQQLLRSLQLHYECFDRGYWDLADGQHVPVFSLTSRIYGLQQRKQWKL